jgi:glyoxylase-like metal-dependent hydrolase (beta-lactamase superfamily II)
MKTFRVAEDVHGIDLGLHDEAVLSGYVVDAAEPLVIEPGHPNGLDRLLAGLDAVGVDPAEVRHVLPSHVHLDHAGAAAGFCEHAPEAVVHHHGATADHLVDPGGLVASSRDVMGEAFADVGEPEPLPEARLDRLDPPETIDLKDRTLEVISTPGHAGDHVAAHLPDAGVLFANEAAVNHYPRGDVWLPPATVPTFEPDDVAESVSRLAAVEADTVALAHFGTVDPDEFVERACERLETVRERVLALYDDHDGDLVATEAAVREDVLGLETYDETVQRLQASVQTHGFLVAASRLEW